MSHTCPVTSCSRSVPDHQLMCARHWALVSPNLRRLLYGAWDRGRGAGTDAHSDAMQICIEEVEFKLGGEPTARRCRECGCLDECACVCDGEPCWWIEEDLCSACAPDAGEGWEHPPRQITDELAGTRIGL